MTGSLARLRMLDLTFNFMGPYASLLLALLQSHGARDAAPAETPT